MSEICEVTGLAPGYVRKLLAGQAPGDLRLSTLQRIAEQLGWKPAEVICAIDCADTGCGGECNGPVPIAASTILDVRAQFWRQLGPRPQLAEAYRVIGLAIGRLGYLELVRDVLSLIIICGPRGAIAPVVARLDAFPDREAPAIRVTREAFATRLRGLREQRG